MAESSEAKPVTEGQQQEKQEDRSEDGFDCAHSYRQHAPCVIVFQQFAALLKISVVRCQEEKGMGVGKPCPECGQGHLPPFDGGCSETGVCKQDETGDEPVAKPPGEGPLHAPAIIGNRLEQPVHTLQETAVRPARILSRKN